MQVWSLDQEDPLEKEMATHTSTFAWERSWTEELGGLWSMGLQRVGHNLVTEQEQTTDQTLVTLVPNSYTCK